MKIFNSLTRQKQDLVTHDEGLVRMYSCGPTVYSYPHIGNMRAYLFMDALRRTLKYNGYKIDGVMNITDVGHMTSDEDEGEDKMLVASKREHKSPWEVAKYYTDIFISETKRLNIDMPEHICPATSVMPEIIVFVKKLIENGNAYETSKGIYFDIATFAGYGKLGGVGLENKLAGARIDIDKEKRHPADFALWIKAPKQHIMQWDSPWGKGYPGWHIECSTIGIKYLGEYIDIHTGGVEHRPVHHENEIAQDDAYAGHQVVSNWMHLEHLLVDGGKMSKSLGNVYKLDDLVAKGFTPEDYRYFFFTTHYAKQQNFTWEGLESAKNALKSMKNILKEHKESTDNTKVKIDKAEKDFLEAINDDLNLPKALGIVWTLLKMPRDRKIYDAIIKFNQIFGFDFEGDIIPTEVQELAKQRWQAKQNRDFATADELRNKISQLGFSVKDTKEGYEIVKN